LETFLKPFCESLFSLSVVFIMMSVASQKHHPYSADFYWGNG